MPECVWPGMWWVWYLLSFLIGVVFIACGFEAYLELEGAAESVQDAQNAGTGTQSTGTVGSLSSEATSSAQTASSSLSTQFGRQMMYIGMICCIGVGTVFYPNDNEKRTYSVPKKGVVVGAILFALLLVSALITDSIWNNDASSLLTTVIIVCVYTVFAGVIMVSALLKKSAETKTPGPNVNGSPAMDNPFQVLVQRPDAFTAFPEASVEQNPAADAPREESVEQRPRRDSASQSHASLYRASVLQITEGHDVNTPDLPAGKDNPPRSEELGEVKPPPAPARRRVLEKIFKAAKGCGFVPEALPAEV